jgi:hypothetical protein
VVKKINEEFQHFSREGDAKKHHTVENYEFLFESENIEKPQICKFVPNPGNFQNLCKKKLTQSYRFEKPKE